MEELNWMGCQATAASRTTEIGCMQSGGGQVLAEQVERSTLPSLNEDKYFLSYKL